MSKLADLVILGATGTTGRQATRFLAAHPEHSKRWTLALAARSKEKLEKMASELSLPQSIRLVVINADDEAAVTELVKQTRVVLNTVGPYAKYGTTVVKACVYNGIHYVDLSGDTFRIRQLIQEYHSEATKTGSIIVNACGFYSLPSDISVYIANKTLRSVNPSLETARSITAITAKGILSSATLESMILVQKLPETVKRDMEREYCLSPSGRTIIGGGGSTGKPSRAIVHRSWGLFEQAASLGKSYSTRYGPSLVYEECLETGGTWSALALSAFIGLFSWSLGILPLRWLLRKVVPGDGSITDKQLEGGHFRSVNVTTSAPTSSHPEGVKVTVTFTGRGDPGYLLSSIFMAECALVLLDTESLSDLAKQGGILTPATAGGDELVKRLQENERLSLVCEMGNRNIESRKSL
ncbi:hypothetical protein VNI00_004150 [Paramarasmius palmivorus]|uniref:Saccharopine dehydrogenase NADP binding domain-containing protein n=1 Tax=Paramarasmius palmivorus TaxID=297713 RepID=A0AAW0DPW2_9AGAR